jgi:hypothetical protein
VLAEIPELVTNRDRQNARMRNLLGAAGSAASVLLFVLVAFWARN